MPSVDFYIDDGAAVITLAESERGNTLYPEFLEELNGSIARAVEDSDVRTIILRSSGPVFSRGMDLGKLTEEGADLSDVSKGVSLYRRLLDALFSSPKPVICVLQGEVKAGGVGIVCACDIVLATPDVTFELSEVLFGLIPANVLPYLLQMRVSLSKARYIILTAKKIEVGEGETLGLVDEVYEEARLEKGIKKICKQLLRSSPAALADVKSFTRQLASSGFDARSELAERKLMALIEKGDALKAARAYQSGELPEWFARFQPHRPLVHKAGSED